MIRLKAHSCGQTNIVHIEIAVAATEIGSARPEQEGIGRRGSTRANVHAVIVIDEVSVEIFQTKRKIPRNLYFSAAAI